MATPTTYAAITAGGATCTNQNKTTGTSIQCTVATENFDVGNVAVVLFGGDNTDNGGNGQLVTSVTDSGSNTWVVQRCFSTSLGAAAGATTCIATSKITTALTSGASTITVNHTSIDAKAFVTREFVVGTGNGLAITGTPQESSSTIDPPLQSITGLPVREYLFLRSTAAERNASAWTPTTNYTTTGCNNSAGTGGSGGNMSICGEYRIVSATSSSASDPTAAAVDNASIYVALREASTTVSGTLYFDEGSTVFNSAKTIKVVTKDFGSLYSNSIATTTTSNGSGVWSISLPVGMATTTPVLVFVDGDTSTRAAFFTKATSTLQNDFPSSNLYLNRFVISHGGTSGTSTTITDLSFYDSDDDTDLQFNASSTALTLTVFANQKLYIAPNKTFAPGGSLTIRGMASSTSQTDGSFHIASGATFTQGGTTTIAGSLSASSTSNINVRGYNFIFNATTTGKTILLPSGNTQLGSTTFNGSGGGWTFATSATTSNITIANGAVTAPQGTLTILGDFTNNGTYTQNGGTTTIAKQGLNLSGTLTGSSALGNLVFSGTSTFTVSTTTPHDAGYGGFTGIAYDPVNKVLYAITDSDYGGGSMYRCSMDTGCDTATDWTVPISSLTIAGALTSIIYDPTSKVIYVGGSELAILRCNTSTQCDQESDWSKHYPYGSASSVNNDYRSLAIDTTNNVLYANELSAGNTVMRCALSTNCDASGDWTVSFSPAGASYGNMLFFDSVNGAMFAGVHNGAGVLWRCPTSLNCDAAGDWTIATTSSWVFHDAEYDSVNGVFYFLTNQHILRCLVASLCDASADFTIATSTGGNYEPYSVTIDTVRQKMYVAVYSYPDDAKVLLTCMLQTVCDASADFTYEIMNHNATSTQLAYYEPNNEILYIGTDSSSGTLYQKNLRNSAFLSNASTSNLVVETGISVSAITTSLVTISGAYSNNGTYYAGTATTFTGTSAQSLGGTMTGTSTFQNVAFTGAGTKTFVNNASTSDFVIDSTSGAVTAPTALTIGGHYTNNSTFTSGATTTLSSTTAQVISGTATGTSAFNTLILQGTSTKTFATNASTSNFIIETNATAILPSLLSISGNYTNNGTTTAGSGTTTFSGTSQQTATGTMTGTSAFYNLAITNNTATTSFNAPLTVSNQFTLNTINSRVALLSNATTTVANLVITGTAGNEIWLRSTTNGAVHKFVVTGAYSVSYANIKDSDACGSTGGTVTASNSTDVSGNSCWSFGGGGGDPVSGIVLSGTLYSDEGITPLTDIATLGLAVGTTTTSVSATTTNASGAYSFNLGTTTISTSTPILLWVDASTTVRAALFTKASSSVNNITGLDLYQNRVIVSHEGTSGTSTTISNMSFYDGTDDSDIQYIAATTTALNTLTVFANQELHIKTGKTFAPGGAVTINGNASSTSQTDGNFHIADSATYTAGGTTTIAGSFIASSTATFTTHASGTVFSATTTGKTVSVPLTTMGNVLFDGSLGGWTIGTTSTSTNFTITNGTVTAPTTTLAVLGNYTNNDTFTNNGGTVTFASSTGVSTYTGTRFNTAGSGNALPVGIVYANGYFYVTDNTDALVYQYTATGSYTGTSFNVIPAPYGITYAQDHFWVADGAGDQIHKYTSAGASANFSFDTSNSGNGNPGSLVFAENHFWVTDASDALVYKYTAQGTYTGTSFSTAGSGGMSPTGIAYVNGYFYIADDSQGEVYVYTTTGVYTGVSFDTAGSGNGTPAGITYAEGALWIADYTDALIYKYSLAQTATGNMTGSSTFNNLVFSGATPKAFANNASSTHFTIATTSGEVSMPQAMTIAGNYINSTTTGFRSNDGIVYFASTSAQTLAGTMIGSSEFATTSFLGTGTKTFSNNASTTSFVINSGSGAVSAPSVLSLKGNYTNNGTFTAGSGTTTFHSVAAQSLTGTLTGLSAFNTLILQGTSTKTFASNASTTNFVNDVMSTAVLPSLFSLTGNYTNNGTTTAGSGTTTFSGTSAQTLAGSMTANSTFNHVAFTGAGAKAFSNNASTTNFRIESGSGAVTAPSLLTIGGHYTNNGIFTANSGTTTFSSSTAQSISGIATGTSAFSTLILTGTSTKTFASNASTTNVIIQNGATAILPSLFSLTGNYTNNGTTTAGTGTTTLNGTATQTLSGTMTGGSAFNNLHITNTSGLGSTSQSVLFLASASTTDTFTMNASTSAQFLANSSSTFQNINLSGASGQNVYLRSSVPGTSYSFYVPGTQKTVSYVDVRDSSACPTIILATNGTNVNSGNNTCWTFAAAVATIASDAHQVFAYLQATTTISPIVITEDASSASITAANDIRLIIATSTTNMRWDTTDVTPTFAGTASGKVSGTVSYAGDGAILIIDVTSDFAPGDTLGVSDLSYARFETVSPATVALGVRTSGAGTSTTNSDSKVVAITGTIAIGSHTSGQIDNALTSRSVSGGELLAFKLTPAGESFDITGLAFPLKGVQGITTGELTSVSLYRDMNSNQTYDAGDVAVGGSGSVSISSQTGTITFNETFQSTTTQDYLLIGDVAELIPTDALVLALSSTNLTSTGATSLIELTESGGIEDYQHIRGGAGGGGGSIGGAAPAGDGIRTGGNEGGGGEVDSNTGDSIGNEVGFNAPSTTGSPDNSWFQPTEAYVSGGAYAYAVTDLTSQSYGTFSFNVPDNNTITGIEVKLEASAAVDAGTLSVELSWDGGSSITLPKTTDTLTTTDAVYALGGPSDTWGRSWTPTETNNSNFVLRVTSNLTDQTAYLDALQVRVYHQATGGGGGGGGAVFKEPNRHFANVYTAVGETWWSGIWKVLERLLLK